MAKKSPLYLTQHVRDISVTERQTFNTCRRRWELSVLENLQPAIPPSFELEFGTGIHRALEGYYIGVANQPAYPDKKKKYLPLRGALSEWDAWYAETDVRLETAQAPIESRDQLQELGDLGEEILRGYDQYAKQNDNFTVHAVEGLLTTPGQSWLKKHWEDRDFIGEVAQNGVSTNSRRLLVPIIHPKTQKPLKGRPVLSARIDLIVNRIDPGMKGIWVYDHKTTTSAPNDRGLDFDDQVTAYCYAVWRWLGIPPRGVCFNYLVKQVPKEPRVLKSGKLSTAKDQLTTSELYREELIGRGLMLKNGSIKGEKYRDAYAALLSRGWDPFFKRHEVTRNKAELVSFEERLYEEYYEMLDCYNGDISARPSFSRWWCPGCRVASICQAIEDDSDVEGIIESRYEDAGDRKAEFDIA
jgi:hypothetical protein